MPVGRCKQTLFQHLTPSKGRGFRHCAQSIRTVSIFWQSVDFMPNHLMSDFTVYYSGNVMKYRLWQKNLPFLPDLTVKCCVLATKNARKIIGRCFLWKWKRI